MWRFFVSQRLVRILLFLLYLRLVLESMRILLAYLLCFSFAHAATLYSIGTPTLQDIWIDPLNGNDARSGATRAEALRSVTAAWQRIPRNQTLTTGYRLQLMAGHHAQIPTYWENRWGTYSAPIIINAADGVSTASIPNPNLYDVHYLYIMGLVVNAGEGGDGLHIELGDHVLLRDITINGNHTVRRGVQEGLKVNQSRYIYIENSDIYGAGDNAIDLVAVHYGHIIGNRIHDANDWCIYLKGGSNDFVVEANRIYDCGTGGFTAGQGTGFQFMDSPWLHYEAYHIKFINNFIYRTEGAAFGVNGGYNILLAYNTAYRVGQRSHLIEVVHGHRSCDGDDALRCQPYLDAGGWGTLRQEPEERIPNRHIYIYNNVVYNPASHAIGDQHFAIYGPANSSASSNLPNPILTDDDLHIRGNIIWNGPTSHPLGVEDSNQGCQPSNISCNASQLRADNSINSVEPSLVDPENGDFSPLPGATWPTTPTFSLPIWSDTDRPARPLAPPNTLDHRVTKDFSGRLRITTGPAGALTGLIAHFEEIAVVEFFHPLLNHYFLAVDAAEIATLDSGGAGGNWQRTGLHFSAHNHQISDNRATCRFYNPRANTHFYTASEEECLALRDSSSGWIFEGIAFYIHLPEAGRCLSNAQAVHRLYNNRFAQNDSNHRFTTSAVVAQEMQAAGWQYEGIAFCAPVPH